MDWNKIENKIDKLFDEETKESLSKWLLKHRLNISDQVVHPVEIVKDIFNENGISEHELEKHYPNIDFDNYYLELPYELYDITGMSPIFWINLYHSYMSNKVKWELKEIYETSLLLDEDPISAEMILQILDLPYLDKAKIFHHEGKEIFIYWENYEYNVTIWEDTCQFYCNDYGTNSTNFLEVITQLTPRLSKVYGIDLYHRSLTKKRQFYVNKYFRVGSLSEEEKEIQKALELEIDLIGSTTRKPDLYRMETFIEKQSELKDQILELVGETNE